LTAFSVGGGEIAADDGTILNAAVALGVMPKG